MALPVLFFLAALAVGTHPPPPKASTGDAGASNQYLVRSADPAVGRAGDLLNAGRPSLALALLQPALQRHPKDAAVLMLAGLAAYRSDHLRAALGYWKRSLEIAPDEALGAIYEDARRESAADRSTDILYSPHVALRYEGYAMPRDAARSVLATLEGDYARLSEHLGCAFKERIIAIVQSREQYLLGTGAAEWSGGHYDGRIHVAWSGEADSGPRMQRALAHELVHACLMNLPSGADPWPVWLQEGLAQKLSGDSLNPSARQQLRELAITHGIPRLEDLDQDWFSLPEQDAVAAYNLALAAADTLYEDYTDHGIRDILTNPEVLPEITADIDAKLGL